MSFIKVNDVNLYYQSVGNGEEVLVFSHGYLMNNTMFNGQIEELKDEFRCISYDHRGHGQSEATEEGYELDNLVDDAIALIESLNLGAVHFIGMSTGGFVGMRIALRRPDLIKSLVLMDTSAEAETKKSLKEYNLLLGIVKYLGWFAVIGQVLPILFHKSFLTDSSRKEEKEKWKKIVTGHNKKAIIAFGKGIFSRNSVLEDLKTLTIPVAIMVGEYDISTPAVFSEHMVEAIPNSQFYTIPDTGHSAAVEKPKEVAKAILDFYSKNTI